MRIRQDPRISAKMVVVDLHNCASTFADDDESPSRADPSHCSGGQEQSSSTGDNTLGPPGLTVSRRTNQRRQQTINRAMRRQSSHAGLRSRNRAPARPTLQHASVGFHPENSKDIRHAPANLAGKTRPSKPVPVLLHYSTASIAGAIGPAQLRERQRPHQRGNRAHSLS